MKEIFDELIAVIDGIEVRGADNRARIDSSIEVLRKLKSIVVIEQKETADDGGKNNENLNDQQGKDASD